MEKEHKREEERAESKYKLLKYTGTAGINGLVGLSPPYILQYSLKNIEQIV